MNKNKLLDCEKPPFFQEMWVRFEEWLNKTERRKNSWKNKN